MPIRRAPGPPTTRPASTAATARMTAIAVPSSANGTAGRVAAPNDSSGSAVRTVRTAAAAPTSRAATRGASRATRCASAATWSAVHPGRGRRRRGSTARWRRARCGRHQPPESEAQDHERGPRRDERDAPELIRAGRGHHEQPERGQRPAQRPGADRATRSRRARGGRPRGSGRSWRRTGSRSSGRPSPRRVRPPRGARSRTAPLASATAGTQQGVSGPSSPSAGQARAMRPSGRQSIVRVPSSGSPTMRAAPTTATARSRRVDDKRPRELDDRAPGRRREAERRERRRADRIGTIATPSRDPDEERRQRDATAVGERHRDGRQPHRARTRTQTSQAAVRLYSPPETPGRCTGGAAGRRPRRARRPRPSRRPAQPARRARSAPPSSGRRCRSPSSAGRRGGGRRREPGTQAPSPR